MHLFFDKHKEIQNYSHLSPNKMRTSYSAGGAISPGMLLHSFPTTGWNCVDCSESSHFDLSGMVITTFVVRSKRHWIWSSVWASASLQCTASADKMSNAVFKNPHCCSWSKYGLELLEPDKIPSKSFATAPLVESWLTKLTTTWWNSPFKVSSTTQSRNSNLSIGDCFASGASSMVSRAVHNFWNKVLIWKLHPYNLWISNTIWLLSLICNTPSFSPEKTRVSNLIPCVSVEKNHQTVTPVFWQWCCTTQCSSDSII